MQVFFCPIKYNLNINIYIVKLRSWSFVSKVDGKLTTGNSCTSLSHGVQAVPAVPHPRQGPETWHNQPQPAPMADNVTSHCPPVAVVSSCHQQPRTINNNDNILNTAVQMATKKYVNINTLGLFTLI